MSLGLPVACHDLTSETAPRAPLTRAQRAVLNCIDYLSRFGYTREQVLGPAG
jgi:hypothetical protein